MASVGLRMDASKQTNERCSGRGGLVVHLCARFPAANKHTHKQQLCVCVGAITSFGYEKIALSEQSCGCLSSLISCQSQQSDGQATEATEAADVCEPKVLALNQTKPNNSRKHRSFPLVDNRSKCKLHTQNVAIQLD